MKYIIACIALLLGVCSVVMAGSGPPPPPPPPVSVPIETIGVLFVAGAAALGGYRLSKKDSEE